MPAQAPLISVLIPTRNRRDLLRQALASARMQTYPNFEILVSDNASDDGTKELLDDAAASDPRVSVVRHGSDISGLPNFLHVLGRARGELVKFLCDDDLLAPTNLERLAGPMLGDPGIVLSFSRRARIDAQGSPLPDDMSTQPLAAADSLLDGRVLGDRTLTRLCNLIGEPSTVLFRRAAVGAGGNPFEIGGARMNHSVDWALWLNVLRHGRAFYAAETLSCFRIHPGQDQARDGRHEQGLA
ncbi:MAG: glycosyltransferase family 2 protein, partial [Acidimicrobiales bacterium]